MGPGNPGSGGPRDRWHQSGWWVWNSLWRHPGDGDSRLAQLKNRIELASTSVAASSEFASLKQKHYDTSLTAAEKALSTISQEVKNIIPPLPQHTDTPSKREGMAPEMALLQQTYDNFLYAHKATGEYLRRLPEYSHDLAELATELNRLDQKLSQAIDSTEKQVKAIALKTLDRNRNQLKSYHRNALFAVAESYDLATANRQ